MSFINELIYTREINKKRIQLEDTTNQNQRKASFSKSTDNQKQKSVRVEKSKIREICMSDAMSFNMLNVYTNLIMKAGYKYIGETEEYEKLFSEMKNYGDKSSIRRLHKELLRDRGQYGAAFLELIPYEDGNGIADLRRVNASKIDYVRDKQGNLILDRNGEPFGFVMDFGANAKLKSKGDTVPSELTVLGFNLNKGQIYLKRDKIVVFPLYRLENNYDYIGLIEPAYQDIVDRLEAAQIQVNALKVKATSKPVITVGDAQHEPTPQMMDDANYLVSNMTEADGLVIPKFMEVSTLEYKSLDLVAETVKMLLSSLAAASGTPLSLITGNGEATNRSTLASHLEMTLSMLQSQVDDYVEDFNMFVIERIKTENNLKGNCSLVWDRIRYEDRLEELENLQKAYLNGGVSNLEYRYLLNEKFNWELKEDYKKKFGEFIITPKNIIFVDSVKNSDTKK